MGTSSRWAAGSAGDDIVTSSLGRSNLSAPAARLRGIAAAEPARANGRPGRLGLLVVRERSVAQPSPIETVGKYGRLVGGTSRPCTCEPDRQSDVWGQRAR